MKSALPLVLHHRIAEITYFPTSACNFRCKHCYMLGKLNRSHDELSTEELRKMGTSLSPLQRTHIGGGEPFMRKDISEVLRVIANDWNSRVICLPTNGSLKNNIVKAVSEYSLHCDKNLRLHFSINDIDDSFDAFTEKTGSFKAWKDSITAVKKITDRFPFITLTALITFNDYNQDRFDRLMQFVVRDIGVDDLSIGLVRSHATYNPAIDIDEFKRVIKKYYRHESGQRPILKTYREMIRSSLARYKENPAYITKCYSGRVRIVVSPEGDIYPCEIMGYPEGENAGDYFMGNIREYDYNMRALMLDERARKIRRRIVKNKCHCHQGVDLSLSLLCSNRFRIKVLLGSLKNLMGKRDNER
jgi:radical SAM protein with 4Fe4S-binding SPASM domain